MEKNFAIIGCGGFVAPRHLQAISEVGGKLLGALDKNDSVGVLDRYFFDTPFFTEVERFDRFLDQRKRAGHLQQINYVSICSPNYLHDSHIRLALRAGAHAICEKPLVLSPWNLNMLTALEKKTGKKVYTVLQLRHHPSLIKLREQIMQGPKDKLYDVDLTYITPRGKWYDYSWKGDLAKSGGIATNLGIHFFDMLIWMFGKIVHSEVHHSEEKKMAGFIQLEKARVRWFLSIDPADLPKTGESTPKPYRSITIDGKEIEFSNVFGDLHTEVYKEILAGRGFGIEDARPSIEYVYKVRTSDIEQQPNPTKMHPKIQEKRNVPPTSQEANGYYAHPLAVVEDTARIGEGTKIWRWSHILPRTTIGTNCVLGNHVMVGPDVTIGNNCKIQNNISVYKGIHLEDNVFCGPSVVFTNVRNPRSFIERKDEFTDITVGEGASIGANATIVAPQGRKLRIGKYALVGAGAVVTKDVPDYGLVLGAPAKQQGWVCYCGATLTRTAQLAPSQRIPCTACDKEYIYKDNQLKQQ